LPLWGNNLPVENVTITSKVVNGFKRGSKMLGVPTANLEINNENKDKVNQLINGVYYGHMSFNTNVKDIKGIDINKTYKAVLSVGYNPHFDNKEKTIEVFLIDYNGDDFYDEIATLKIEGYIRSEAQFEDFSELVTSISYDIAIADEVLNN
jgi:FAD synthase